MRAYNIEFFDQRTFALLYYTNVELVEFVEDYLNPTEMELPIMLNDPTKITIGNYIRIKRQEIEYFGVVIGCTVVNKKQVNVKFTSFLGRFNQEILFDTNLQGSRSVELFLSDTIQSLWTTTTDRYEKVNGLRVVTTSYTPKWGFNIKSDIKDSHFAKITSFLKTFILRSMEKYGICFDISLDIVAQEIVLTIGTNNAAIRTIEADLPNIIYKDITIAQGDNEVNKLIVYDTSLGDAMPNNPITYYLYSYGEISKHAETSYRIIPVVRQVEMVTSSEEDSFEVLAENAAYDVLGNVEHENYIEIEVLPDDELVRPREMKYGQHVQVISNRTKYTSILTGKKINDKTITLMFGTIRLDLTSKL